MNIGIMGGGVKEHNIYNDSSYRFLKCPNKDQKFLVVVRSLQNPVKHHVRKLCVNIGIRGGGVNQHDIYNDTSYRFLKCPIASSNFFNRFHVLINSTKNKTKKSWSIFGVELVQFLKCHIYYPWNRGKKNKDFNYIIGYILFKSILWSKYILGWKFWKMV